MITKNKKAPTEKQRKELLLKGVITIVGALFLNKLSYTLLMSSETNTVVTAEQANSATLMSLVIRWLSYFLGLVGSIILVKAYLNKK